MTIKDKKAKRINNFSTRFAIKGVRFLSYCNSKLRLRIVENLKNKNIEQIIKKTNLIKIFSF